MTPRGMRPLDALLCLAAGIVAAVLLSDLFLYLFPPRPRPADLDDLVDAEKWAVLAAAEAATREAVEDATG